MRPGPTFRTPSPSAGSVGGPRASFPRLPPLSGAILLLLAFAVVPAPPLTAQTVVGRTLDDARGGPVGGALVRLLDRDGEERAQAVADAAGRFVIMPPKRGEYYLEATRIGYRRAVTPLLALSEGGHTAELDLMMAPAPIGLEGLSVEVDLETRATEALAMSGITPAVLGNRFITRKEIEAVAVKPDVGRVLEWQGIGGMRVIRPENLTPGSDNLGLCVSLVRARTGSGGGRCARVFLDGVAISPILALEIDPETLEGMALLTPLEASVAYGGAGSGGVLLLWTRTGGGS